MKIFFSQEDMELIFNLYLNENKSILFISSIFGVSSSAITRVLKENNIKIRDNNFYKPKSINFNFFEEINTEEKAYILGFIYADGCISNGTISIKQKTSDIDILIKIKNILKSDHKIINYIENSGYSNNCKVSMLSFKNSKMVKDLHKCGVVENKSKILIFPSFIHQKLIPHFIRGYFDGDGSVYKKKQDDSIGIGFTGTLDFLTGILKYLQQICDTKSKIFVYKNKNIYGLNIGGVNKVQKIYNYLYNDATIYLNRKEKIFDDFYKSS